MAQTAACDTINKRTLRPRPIPVDHGWQLLGRFAEPFIAVFRTWSTHASLDGFWLMHWDALLLPIFPFLSCEDLEGETVYSFDFWLVVFFFCVLSLSYFLLRTQIHQSPAINVANVTALGSLQQAMKVMSNDLRSLSSTMFYQSLPRGRAWKTPMLLCLFAKGFKLLANVKDLKRKSKHPKLWRTLDSFSVLHSQHFNIL